MTMLGSRTQAEDREPIVAGPDATRPHILQAGPIDESRGCG